MTELQVKLARWYAAGVINRTTFVYFWAKEAYNNYAKEVLDGLHR